MDIQTYLDKVMPQPKAAQQVAILVTKGLSNAEIANYLGLQEKTVKIHLSHCYETLNVKSRAQLIVKLLPYLGFVEKNTEEVF